MEKGMPIAEWVYTHDDQWQRPKRPLPDYYEIGSVTGDLARTMHLLAAEHDEYPYAVRITFAEGADVMIAAHTFPDVVRLLGELRPALG